MSENTGNLRISRIHNYLFQNTILNYYIQYMAMAKYLFSITVDGRQLLTNTGIQAPVSTNSTLSQGKTVVVNKYIL